MRFWVSHMLEPDWPLLDRQVWLMMLAHACMVKGMRCQNMIQIEGKLLGLGQRPCTSG